MTAISVSERLLEMAAFYTPLALTVTEAGRGGHHRRGHQPANAVNTVKKYRAGQEKSRLALSGTFRPFPRVGQCVSLEETSKIKHLKKLRITKENHRNQVIPVIFGGDYWTRTSGLMRVKIR